MAEASMDKVNFIANMITEDPNILNKIGVIKGKCKNCGNRVRGYDAFCDKCGKKKTKESVEQEEFKPTNR